MSTWTGHKHEALIEEFIGVCRKHNSGRKEARPDGWVVRRSTSTYSKQHGKGSGVKLSTEVSSAMGISLDALGFASFGGRAEAVVVGIMAWPDSLPELLKLRAVERKALMKMAVRETDLAHQLALAALYHRIMLRSKK